MFTCDVPTKCRRNTFLIRTDRKVEVKSFCIMEQPWRTVTPSLKLGSTGALLGRMVKNFLSFSNSQVIIASSKPVDYYFEMVK